MIAGRGQGRGAEPNPAAAAVADRLLTAASWTHAAQRGRMRAAACALRGAMGWTCGLCTDGLSVRCCSEWSTLGLSDHCPRRARCASSHSLTHSHSHTRAPRSSSLRLSSAIDSQPVGTEPQSSTAAQRLFATSSAAAAHRAPPRPSLAQHPVAIDYHLIVTLVGGLPPIAASHIIAAATHSSPLRVSCTAACIAGDERGWCRAMQSRARATTPRSTPTPPLSAVLARRPPPSPHRLD